MARKAATAANLVAVGTPEDVAGNKHSYTGHYLVPLLGKNQAA
ncbi:MAG: hypothetical protein R3F24_08715 [Gammaproteobacteria bacterium]